tara:strand:- start:15746 stop:16054 length:309 start_codon:yes stop_codon:yes gene_type:complete
MELLRIKDILEEREISRLDFSKNFSVSSVSIYNIINGESFPRPELLKQIAEVLDVDIRELFHPTKAGNSTEGVLNGFVEFQGKVYRINTLQDLQELNRAVNQ